MMLTKRLAACAELVTGQGIACDVGTDHAYLAAALLQSGRCERVIAADIGQGPLDAARRTLEQAGLTHRAELVLSDGLAQIDKHGVTDVIIAGMGGETIVHILSECDWIRQGVNLILQPMTKAPVLRQWLAQEGFSLVQEEIVQEGRFFYHVIQVKDAQSADQPWQAWEMELGKLDWTLPQVQGYGAFRLKHYQQLTEQMAKTAPQAAEKYQQLCTVLQEHLEIGKETITS